MGKTYIQSFPKVEKANLEKMFPGASKDALDFLKESLNFNPKNRISIEAALAHPFFSKIREVKREQVKVQPFILECENIPENDMETLKKAFKSEVYKWKEGGK